MSESSDMVLDVIVRAYFLAPVILLMALYCIENNQLRIQNCAPFINILSGFIKMEALTVCNYILNTFELYDFFLFTQLSIVNMLISIRDISVMQLLLFSTTHSNFALPLSLSCVVVCAA